MPTLEFTRCMPPYQAGELATVSEAEAIRILATGGARPYAPKPDKSQGGRRVAGTGGGKAGYATTAMDSPETKPMQASAQASGEFPEEPNNTAGEPAKDAAKK